jgi:hypothetical protein
VAYFSEHHRRKAAIGAYDWPIPKQGLRGIDRFQRDASEWLQSIPVAFPRFIDIYAKAKLHEGYGRVDDNQGATFRESLEKALDTNSSLIQICTWNDWGEGTIIEPSREYQYRDLEWLQEMRRTHIDTRFEPDAADLRLPHQLLQLRRTVAGEDDADQLDRIAQLMAEVKLTEARSRLNRLRQP